MAHAAAIARLRSVPTAQFDRAFLRHEIAFHQSVIDAVKGTLLPAIRNEELTALVVKVAPAFESHRLAAEHLLKKGAGKRGSSGRESATSSPVTSITTPQSVSCYGISTRAGPLWLAIAERVT